MTVARRCCQVARSCTAVGPRVRSNTISQNISLHHRDAAFDSPNTIILIEGRIRPCHAVSEQLEVGLEIDERHSVVATNGSVPSARLHGSCDRGWRARPAERGNSQEENKLPQSTATTGDNLLRATPAYLRSLGKVALACHFATSHKPAECSEAAGRLGIMVVPYRKQVLGPYLIRPRGLAPGKTPSHDAILHGLHCLTLLCQCTRLP